METSLTLHHGVKDVSLYTSIGTFPYSQASNKDVMPARYSGQRLNSCSLRHSVSPNVTGAKSFARQSPGFSSPRPSQYRKARSFPLDDPKTACHNVVVVTKRDEAFSGGDVGQHLPHRVFMFGLDLAHAAKMLDPWDGNRLLQIG